MDAYTARYEANTRAVPIPVAAGVPAGRPETHTRPRTLKGESRAVISQALADVMKPGSEERLWKLNKQEPRRGGPTVAVGETHGKGYHKPVMTLAGSTNLS